MQMFKNLCYLQLLWYYINYIYLLKSPYLPIGIVLSIFGCLTCYWVDKYLLLRRYVVPFYLDKRLANTMIGMLPSYTVKN